MLSKAAISRYQTEGFLFPLRAFARRRRGCVSRRCRAHLRRQPRGPPRRFPEPFRIV